MSKMSKIAPSLMVFKEEGLDIGFFASDYQYKFSIDEVVFSPNPFSSALWKFKGKNNYKYQGKFLHLGSALGATTTKFNHTGWIFCQRTKNGLFGVFFNRLTFQANHLPKMESLSEDHWKKSENDSAKVLFHQSFSFRRKTVLLLEPERIIRAFKPLLNAKLPPRRPTHR